MRVHLVTYATPRFQLRQAVLGWSARLNGVADTVTAWDPKSLLRAGFVEDMPEIDLSQRGSGYWAWKAYIIHRKLSEVPDGDLVFYCDVGRRYPFKTLVHPVTPYLEWMRSNSQDVMPGLHIPWKGPMSMWTKRIAFQAAGLDTAETHRGIPIQASFSFWIAGEGSRSLCKDWLQLCSRKALISDDPSPAPLEELPDFYEHRHDQSLLSLCCMKAGVRGIDLGNQMPSIDTQHPDEILDLLGDPRPRPHLVARILTACAAVVAAIEQLMRRRVKFGEHRPGPDFQSAKSSTHEKATTPPE